jgi:hypothetical protein
VAKLQPCPPPWQASCVPTDTDAMVAGSERIFRGGLSPYTPWRPEPSKHTRTPPQSYTSQHTHTHTYTHTHTHTHNTTTHARTFFFLFSSSFARFLSSKAIAFCSLSAAACAIVGILATPALEGTTPLPTQLRQSPVDGARTHHLGRRSL